MSLRLHAWLLGLLVAVAAMAVAAQPAGDMSPLQFQDRAEESRFQHLTAELRCVMCQNQSLADSNAQVAQDMRREVLALMRQGRSDAEIRQFLVERYGEFVLYRPTMDRHTWLLWFGPGVVLLAGTFVVWRIVRRRAAALAAQSGPRGEPAPGTPERPEGDQEW